MSVTLVGTPTKGGSATSAATITVTTPSSTGVGDLLVVVFGMRGNSLSTPVGPTTDWVVAGGASVAHSGNTGATAVMVRESPSSGAQSFAFTFIRSDTSAVLSSLITVWECYVLHGQKSGVTTSSPLASLASGSGTTQAVTFPSVTTTEDGEPILRVITGQVTSSSTDEKSPTWDAAVGNVVSAQGGGTTTGFQWSTASLETGPTPAGSVSSRTLNLQNTPSTWSRQTFGVLAAPSGAPSSTVAPAVTGTAAVGSVLTSTSGTWNQTGLTYAYQWQRDGANISGATGTTYTVVSADAGHTLTSVVSATNTSSQTGTATSNGTAIPAVPVNTVAPVVTTDGTPATGETITVDTGTWTGTGISYTYQWYRGASPLTGATSSSYTLVVSDEGASISARVTATNGGGSATANSNTITPAVTAPISDASYLNYLSGGTGNTSGAASIGGARGATWAGTVDDLFGPVIGTVAQAGGTFYRLIYPRNTHTTTTATAGKAFIEAQFPSSSGLTLAVGVPTEAVNTDVTAVASGTTAPAGVTFTTATTSGTGRTYGDLPPSGYRGLWLKLVVAPGTVAMNEYDATWAIEFS